MTTLILTAVLLAVTDPAITNPITAIASATHLSDLIVPALWAVLYIAMGKLEIKGVVVEVPFVSPWLASRSGPVKTAIIAAVSVIIGIVTTWQAAVGPADWNAILGTGLLDGIRIAAGSMGIHSALKSLGEGSGSDADDPRPVASEPKPPKPT